MQSFRIRCTLLAACLAVLPPVLVAGDEPSPEEQAAIIAEMRDAAAKYQDAMPNYLCTRVVEHFESPLKRIRWHEEGKEIGELSVVAGQEHVQNTEEARRHWRLVSLGEFGADVTQVLNPESDAHFEWLGWDSISGRRVAKFHFEIDQAHSTKTFSNFGVSARIPYHGTLWADQETGIVLRVYHEADEIPPELVAQKLQTTVDFATVSISGQPAILPVHAVVESKDDHRWIKNEIEFRNFREFQADSKITFGPPTKP